MPVVKLGAQMIYLKHYLVMTHLGAIADLVADYWSREFQGFTVNTLKGVFGSASMAGNTHDISAGTGAAAVIDGHIICRCFL